jgi:hypothetical protein
MVNTKKNMKNLRFGSHLAQGLHLGFVGVFEFGLNVISDGEASHLSGAHVGRWDHLIQKCL